MAKGQYLRIYHSLKDEYPGVWKSDAQLALFVRLLLVADKWWPQLAPIGPRNGAYQSLLECGLVIENEGATGYSIKGMDKERSVRSEHGRHAVSKRWEYSENTQPIPSKAEQNKAKQSSGNGFPGAYKGIGGPMPAPPPDDPSDEVLVTKLRRFASSEDGVVARNAQARLARMGL